MARKRLGELLLERGIISVQQLEEGLAAHRQNRTRLGVALIQKGFLSEDQLAKALSEALAIELVELKGITVDWSAVHLIRPRFCEQHDLFPYALESAKGRKQLVVAMADPLNMPAIEEIEFTTGLKVTPKLAPLSAVRAAILKYYHKVDPGDGRMEIVGRGGVPIPQQPPPEDEEVIVGEEVREVTARTALADLIKTREQQRQQKKAQKAAAGAGALSKDLDYLFGLSQDADAVEQLERKFWALMRIMARKGLITKDEFQRELDEGD